MSKNLVIVDVQPFYHNWHKHLTPYLIEYVNMSNYSNMLYFFNGEEMGIPDNVNTVAEYLVEHELDETKLNRFYFIEKDYSFFRGWMDLGIDDEVIVSIVKYMLKNKIYDSREIDPDDLLQMLESSFGDESNDIFEQISDEVIFIPSWDYSKLQAFNKYDLCGGAREECLKEIEILLQALDIEYNVIENLTY